MTKKGNLSKLPNENLTETGDFPDLVDNYALTSDKRLCFYPGPKSEKEYKSQIYSYYIVQGSYMNQHFGGASGPLFLP